MQHHWHFSIENFVWTGVAAIVFINLFRILSAHLASQPGMVGSAGKAAGGLVTWG